MKLRKTLSYLLVIIQFMGMGAFIFNMLLSFQNLKFDGELPITDIQDIQEQNDKIYIGLGAYNRIQVYDLKGKYLNFKNTNNAAKDFDFAVDIEGKATINVIYLRPGFPKRFPQLNGDRYLKVSQFPLKINKIDENGEHLVIQQPLQMSLWGGTFIPWVIAVICAILFILINSVILMEVFVSNFPQNEKVKLAFRRIFICG
jgi:hypothetical protein